MIKFKNKLLSILIFLVTTTFYGQVADNVPTDGLVAYYSFSGNANDESGNGNNGTVNGATLSTDRFGNSDSAYYFSSNGCATRIDADVNTSSIQTGLTISLWAWREGNGCISPRLFEFWPGNNGPGSSQWKWTNGSNIIGMGSITSSGFQCSSSVPSSPNNVWVNIVYTNDGINGKFYKDGVLINTLPSNGNPILAGNLAIGRMNHPAWDAWNGKIDDFGIWNRALTDEEIINLYNTTECTEVLLGNDIETCIGDTVILDAGASFETYMWNTGETTRFIEVTENGDYSVTVNNFTNTTSGIINLDGSNDYIEVNHDVLNNISSGTIQIRCKFESPTDHKNIFFYGSENDSMPGLELRANDQGPYFSWHPGVGNVQSIFSQTPLDVFEWHTYTVQWSENSLELYTDGELVGSSNSISSNLNNLNSKIRIGRMGNSSSTFSNLSIDYLKIYNEKQFSNNFDDCQILPTQNLILYYNFDTNNNEIVEDLSGNNYHGTIYNSPSWLEEETNECNACTASDSIIVNFNATTSPTGDTEQTFCNAPTIADLVATGDNIQWYDAATGGNVLDATTALIDGQIVYASQTINDCESTDRLEVVVSIQDIQITASATEICAGDSATLNLTLTNAGGTGVEGQLVNEFNHTITTNASQQFPTTVGLNYRLEIEGNVTWGTYCPALAYDPAYVLNGFYGVNEATPREFSCNDSMYSSIFCDSPGLRPIPDQYDGINHTYDYYFVANTNQISVGFFDNLLGDNCGSITFRLFENSNPPNQNSLVWSTSDTTATISVTPTETTDYWVDITTNGVTCREHITINVTTPEAPAGDTEQTFCNTPTVADLVATGDNIQWHDAATGGNVLDATTALIDGQIVYASQTINDCESTERLEVSVTIQDIQITASATEICAGESVDLSISSGLATSGTACISTELPTNLQNGLVGYWPFCGNANDESGNGNNGSVNGATLTADRFGNADSAYNFEENDSYIQIDGNNLPQFSNKFSYAVQFKVNEITSGTDCTPSSNIILNNEGLYELGIDCNGLLSYAIANEDPSWTWVAITQVSLNQWYEFIFIYNEGEINIYLDGNLFYNYSGFGSLVDFHPDLNDLRFGNRQLNDVSNIETTSSFNGKIDEIAIWNRALAPSEIQQLANASTYTWSTGDTTATISVTPTETTDYWVDVTTNGVTCRENITINVTTPEAPTGDTEQTFCNAPTIADLVATGDNIQWYDAATDGNLLDNTTALIDGQIVYASQNINDCESTERLEVSVTIQDIQITASATEVCAGEGVDLNVIGDVNSTYLWSTGESNFSGQGTLVDEYSLTANIVSQNTFSIIPGNIYRLEVSGTISLGGGAGNQRDVAYFIQSGSDGTIEGTPFDSACNSRIWTSLFCDTPGLRPSPDIYDASTHTYNYPFTANSSTLDVGFWDSPLGDNGPNVVTFKLYELSNSESTITVNPTETTEYWVDITTNGITCREHITINVTTPEAPTGDTQQTFCNAPTIADLVATGGNIQWYDAATDGNLLDNSTALIDGQIVYASQTINDCESTDRLEITVTVQDIQITASATEVCAGDSVTLSVQGHAQTIGTVQIFVDGVLVNSETDLNFNNLNHTAPMFFGVENPYISLPSGPQYLNGTLDDIAIWNRALSPSDVMSLYNNPSVCSISDLSSNLINGLVGYWPFCGNANDIGEFNLNGVNHGGTLQTDRFGNSGRSYFLGPNNWIEVNHNNVLNISQSSYTLSAWVKKETSGPSQFNHFITKTNVTPSPYSTKGFCLRYENSTAAFFETQHPPGENFIPNFNVNSSQIDMSQWHLITGVYYGSVNTDETSIIWSTGDTTATISVTPTETTDYWVDVTTNGVTCRENITINVTTPEAPTGDTEQTFCNAPTVADLVATGDNIQWYDAATGGNVLDATTALIDGQIVYASQTTNDCESTERLEVTVTVQDIQITASATEICAGESVTLSLDYQPPTICDMDITLTDIPLGEDIPGFTYGGFFNNHHYYVYDSPTTWTEGEQIARANGGYLVCINDESENTFVSNLTNNNIWIGLFRDAETCEFRWLDCIDIAYTNWRPGEPNSGPCGEPYAQIIRGCSFGFNTWNNLGNNASNGSCYSNMVPIMEIDPTIYESHNLATASFLWSTGDTTETISVTPTATTAYWLDVTTNGVTCRENITVTVNEVPLAPVSGGDIVSCAANSLDTLTAQASVNVNESVVWYNAATAGNIVTTPNWSEVGSITYYAEAVNTITGCTSETRTPVTLTIQAAPSAPNSAGNLEVCEVSPFNPLTATAIATPNQVIIWYDALEDGNIIDNPVLNTTGTITYYAEAQNVITGCLSITRTPVTLTINTAPNAPVSNGNITECKLNPLQTLTAAAFVEANQSITWYNNAVDGIVVENPSLSNTGVITYYAEAVDNDSGCTSLTRTPVTLTITNTPEPPEGQSIQEFCYAAQISDLLVTGENLAFYTSEFSTENLPLDLNLNDGDRIYVSQSVNNCESLTRLEINIILHEIPDPINTNTTLEYCLGANTTLADLEINEQGFDLEWYNAATGFTAYEPNTILENGVTYYATLYDPVTGCESLNRLAITPLIRPCNIKIYNALSLNEDGKNDYMVIENVQFYPINTLEVYNRNGQLVFKTTAYGQNNANYFYGKANVSGIVGDGNKLPTGSYMYVFKYFDAFNTQEHKSLKGFLTINSN